MAGSEYVHVGTSWCVVYRSNESDCNHMIYFIKWHIIFNLVVTNWWQNVLIYRGCNHVSNLLREVLIQMTNLATIHQICYFPLLKIIQ